MSSNGIDESLKFCEIGFAIRIVVVLDIPNAHGNEFRPKSFNLLFEVKLRSIFKKQIPKLFEMLGWRIPHDAKHSQGNHGVWQLFLVK